MLSLNKENIILTFLSRLSIVLSGFGVSVLTAHFLAPEGRGEYFYILTVVNVVSLVCALGMQTSNTYLIASQPELKSSLTVNSFWISFVFSLLTTVVIIFGFKKFGNYHSNNLWFCLMLIPCYLFYLFAVSIMGGLGWFKKLNLYQLGMNGLTVIAVFLAGMFTKNLTFILLAVSMAWLLITYFSVTTLLNDQQLKNYKFNYALFKKSFTYALKAYFVGVATYLVLRINVFFLQEMSPAAELGYFSIAAQICDALILLPMAVNMVLFPHLVKSQVKDLSIIVNTIKNIGFVMLVLTVLTWFIAPFFIPMVFGKIFTPSTEILKYMLPGCFFYSLITLLTQHLAARGFPPAILLGWCFALVLNAALCYFLIPIYGAHGAALALTLCYGFVFIVFSLVVYQDGVKMKKNQQVFSETLS